MQIEKLPFTCKKIPYSCSRINCNTLYYSYQSLKDHQCIHDLNENNENILENNQVKCPLCFELISIKYNQFEKHLNIHKDRFMNRKNKTDIRSHENECFLKSNFTCTYSNCQQNFKYTSNLKEHIERHFKVKQFQCSQCKKKFSNLSITQNHLYSHITTRPYNCYDQSCKYSFINISQLKFHIKSKHNYKNKDYKLLLDKYLNKNMTEINRKITLFNNEFELFKAKYPIIDLLNDNSIYSEEESFLHRKRDLEEEPKISKTFEESLSNEEKIIYFLLSFIKEKTSSPLFEKLITILDTIEDESDEFLTLI